MFKDKWPDSLFYRFLNGHTFYFYPFKKSKFLNQMIKIFLAACILQLLFLSSAFGDVRLAIITRPGSSTLTLEWNMTNYPGLTTYALFESPDGFNWTIAAANPAERRYTAMTVMEYQKKFGNERQLYFKVKVYDPNENIIAISNTALVVNPEFVPSYRSNESPKPSYPLYSGASRTQWQLIPPGQWDVLELRHTGQAKVTGVIQVDIYNNNGRDVQKFRASSKSRELKIPIRQLPQGTYHVLLRVENQNQLNTYFTRN